MRLVFANPDLLGASLPNPVMPSDLEAFWQQELAPLAVRIYAQTGITQRVPFVVRDNQGQAALGLDEDLTEVLRRMSDQVPGRTTMNSYGRYAFNFLEELDRQNVTLATVTPSYLMDYKRRRHMPGKNGKAIAQQSWNSEAAAIKTMFDVALIIGTRPDNPCNYPELNWANTGAAIEPEEPKFITLEQFTRFRDVGLMHARCRSPLRNAAFAETALTSGMRLTEANGLQMFAIPAKPDQVHGTAFRYNVPAEDAKGHRRRKVPISTNAFQTIVSYRDLERRSRLDRWNLTHETVSQLWLNQSGNAMDNGGWEAVFRDASRRSGVDVTPHTLRHTFAVYMLSALLRHSMRSASEITDGAKRLTDSSVGDRRDVYSSIFGDPLRKLQKLLGHKRYETTFIYLDVLSADDELIDDALSIFDTAFGSEEAYPLAA